MAYDELLADRVRTQLTLQKTSFTEKKMMGGLCFMVDDKMCINITQKGLMTRIDPGDADELLKKEGAEQMIHGKRIMTGFLRVHAEAVDLEDDLLFWIDKCLEFNPKAKSSKKKK